MRTLHLHTICPRFGSQLLSMSIGPNMIGSLFFFSLSETSEGAGYIGLMGLLVVDLGCVHGIHRRCKDVNAGGSVGTSHTVPFANYSFCSLSSERNLYRVDEMVDMIIQRLCFSASRGKPRSLL